MEWIVNNWSKVVEVSEYAFWIVFASGFVFEAVPIKFSPISAILGWIGKKLNRDVEKKMVILDAKVDTVQKDLQCHQVESQRRSILNFADKLMRLEQKTKEDFDSIIKLHDEYEKYIKKNGIENGQISLAFDYISARYIECRENNSFYTGK